MIDGEMAKYGRSGGRWRSVERTEEYGYYSHRVELSDEGLETLDIDPDDPEGWIVNLFTGDWIDIGDSGQQSCCSAACRRRRQMSNTNAGN